MCRIPTTLNWWKNIIRILNHPQYHWFMGSMYSIFAYIWFTVMFILNLGKYNTHTHWSYGILIGGTCNPDWVAWFTFEIASKVEFGLHLLLWHRRAALLATPLSSVRICTARLVGLDLMKNYPCYIGIMVNH